VARILLTSVPFAMVHLWNPNVVRGVTFINTALAGLWPQLPTSHEKSLAATRSSLVLGGHSAHYLTPVSGLTLVSHPLAQGRTSDLHG
jgi:hypothetical protein